MDMIQKATEALEHLKHPGHPDQNVHGRRGSSSISAAVSSEPKDYVHGEELLVGNVRKKTNSNPWMQGSSIEIRRVPNFKKEHRYESRILGAKSIGLDKWYPMTRKGGALYQECKGIVRLFTTIRCTRT